MVADPSLLSLDAFDATAMEQDSLLNVSGRNSQKSPLSVFTYSKSSRERTWENFYCDGAGFASECVG